MGMPTALNALLLFAAENAEVGGRGDDPSFNIGPEWSCWMGEMDRLFDLRDDAVHREEALRPMVVTA
jgi:hypothetical protein